MILPVRSDLWGSFEIFKSPLIGLGSSAKTEPQTVAKDGNEG